ncbi:DUF2730 family protein [Shewanella algae]|nr:DUF2730 family protein [Shewanella algae]
MVLDVLFKVWPIVAAVGSLIVTLVLAWLYRKFVPMTDHQKLVQRVNAHEKRLTKVEQHMEAMPTREELHQLDKTLIGLGARFGAMEQGINHIRTNVDMLIENEISQERRGG